MKEHKNYHQWITQTAELQLYGGIHTPINSDIVHLQNLMNITINLAKYDRQVLKLFLKKYFHPSNIKIDLSDHSFIKDYIFEVNVNFPPI